MNNLQKLIEKTQSIGKAWSWRYEKAWLRGDEITYSTDSVSQPYKQSIWVYIAVSAIARNIGQVPFKFYRGEDEIDSGPLFDLFGYVNEYMSSFQLWETTSAHLNLRGNAIWMLEKSKGMEAKIKGSLPSAIYPVGIDNFEYILDDKGHIDHWIYKSGSVRRDIDPQQVIHFKLFNPYDTYLGLSPIEALRLSMETDYEAMKSNRNFFKKGAILSGILTFDEALTDPQFERARAQIEERHTGSDRSHGIMVMDGKSGKWQSISPSQRDMDFINQRRMSREEVLAAYGVPKTIVSLSDNQAMPYAREQKKIFWNDKLMPELMLFQTKIQTDFLDRFIPNEKITCKPDLSHISELQEDLGEKADTSRKYFDMGIPINQLIDVFELPFEKVPWGDKWWAPFSVMPVSGEGPSPKKPEEEEREEEKGLRGRRIPNLETVEQRDAYWEKWVQPFGRWEEKIKKESRQLWREMKESNLAAIERNWQKRDFSGWSINKVKEAVAKDAMDDLIFEYDLFSGKWRNGMKPLISSAYGEAGSRTMRLLEISVNFNLSDPRAVKWIEKRGLELAKSVTGTAKEEVRTILRYGMEEGLTTSDMAKKIGEYYDSSELWKAERIARTETMMASNEGTVEGYKQSGVVEGKEFLTARDERVCEICGPMDKEEVSLNENFSEGDPPVHPNCRCTVIPILKE